MPFSMSRIVFIGQNALIIANKAANEPPAMQLLKKQQTNNQGMGSGEVGWGAVTSPFNECMGVLLKKMSLASHKLDQEFEKYLGKNKKKQQNNPTPS